jgi:hypothetical protein
MSTTLHKAASPTDKPLTNLLRVFDHPGADIVLRSQDAYHFRVPKIYTVNSSPILGKLIRRTLDSPDDANAIPVVHLPERGKILHCLLTFIFPVTPLVPSTLEEIMELLSVAQKYQMRTALTHIRGSIARQNSLPMRPEPALHMYALAQKYMLRPEALQAARTIFLKQSMTIEDLDNKLDIMPSAYLYELLKYHERVRAILASDLTKFRMSSARGTITGFRCTELSSSQIPGWLDHYICSIEKAPNLFDIVEFNAAMARHIADRAATASEDLHCDCITSQTRSIRGFWEALGTVIDGSFEKVSGRCTKLLRILNLLQAEPALSLVLEPEGPRAQINPTIPTTSPPDANIIIRSSDLVDFRVHKSVLTMASPFFKYLLSLPQPSDSKSVNGLPVIELSEDSEVLNSLVSILYPVHTVIPTSYKKVLYLQVLVMSVVITNPLSQGIISTCGMPEIRHGFGTVIYPCRGQARDIPCPKGSRGFPCIRNCR